MEAFALLTVGADEAQSRGGRCSPISSGCRPISLGHDRLGRAVRLRWATGRSARAGPSTHYDGSVCPARHPMYLGVLLAAAGAWLIFRTWAMMLFAPMAVVFSIASAAREEKLLERQHRDTWQISCIQSAKVVLVIVLEKRGAHRRRPGSASASRTPDDMGILIVE